MRLKTALLPLTMPLLLAACFGGGGGGSSSGQSGPLTLNSTPTAAFTSFEDIQANSLVQLDSPDLVDDGDAAVPMSLNKAMELDGDGNVPADGSVTGDVTTTTDPSFIRLLSGDLDDENEPELEALRLSVGLPAAEPAVVDFYVDDEAEASPADHDLLPLPLVLPDYATLENTDPNDADVVTDRLVVHAAENEADEFDYMAFGVWQLDLLQSTGNFGGAAWGRVTEVADMPDVNALDATYNGGLLGQHVEEDTGEITLYEAESTVTASFANATVVLSSTNTRNLETGTVNPNLNLQMRGNQTADLSGNYFVSGPDDLVLEAVSNVDGQFGGAFYGDNAEEVGGWFDIENRGNGSRYFGSFGAKHTVN